ncbi:MAG: phospholipase C, phosphocholine-specific [Verrucomicrobiota bacterium]
MGSRRNFLKQAALLAAGGGLSAGFPLSIRRAWAIEPSPGTTFLDAEHVVILMQENRSFDHCYGTLRGVRGFGDPRAVTLPSGDPVWLQTNRAGETYAPFRLNIKETKATWMSSLPHSWVDQVDARNQGKHDRWLDAKRSGNAAYAQLPLTLGFYNRDDLPFYYALADAFTVCDQNFCSSLTGTTPNRLYLWTGTIREKPSISTKANIRNEDVDYGAEAKWRTFPERLEELGISWRVYQNEISLPTGLEGEAEAWLANFTDNPLEWFTQYHVRFSAAHRRFVGQSGPASDASFARLPPREQQLHQKAFTTNEGDPDYRKLTTLSYKDGKSERVLQVPKGDILYRFRRDVAEGQLPTVSWIVAPENFSDHPGAPWFGAWYVSEVLDILTRQPEVWKKTIFILCYDENDGYFDHVPPFVPPHPDQAETGKVSNGIDTSVEHVRLEQEQERQRIKRGPEGRAGPIGLGFRVPLVIASPWSRGGYVCSQVFDHTSILRLLERILSQRTGREVRETNISAWRRTVCGDLSSAFRSSDGPSGSGPTAVAWPTFAASIHQAKFKPVPNGFKRYSSAEITAARHDPRSTQARPRQEPGLRPSCALPYELSVDGWLDEKKAALVVELAAAKERFGAQAAGAPFHVYAPGKTRFPGQPRRYETGRTWTYAVAAGDRLRDAFPLADFADERYHLRVLGPNGFFREFAGNKDDPWLQLLFLPSPEGKADLRSATLRLVNKDRQRTMTAIVSDLSYGAQEQRVALGAAGDGTAPRDVSLDLSSSHGWYDVRVRIEGAAPFERRYAGRIENGSESFSDPLLGL